MTAGALRDMGTEDAASTSTAAPWQGVAFVALAAALAASLAILLTWPMRIWHRPVSPLTHLVGTLGISYEGATTYVLTVTWLFVLYGAALYLVVTRRVRPPAWAVLAGAGLFCLILWPTHPLTSTDVFNYIAGGRILWSHGENPLTTPPLAHPEDPFFGLLAFWQDIPSPYGPLWSALTGVPHALGGDDPLRTVLAYKALAIGFMLGTGRLLYLTARRLRPENAVPALFAFTWNPLVLWHVAGNGHNDVVMMFFVAFFLYALARGRVAAALVALAASALVKYATLLIVPILVVWWLRSGQRPSIQQLALGGVGALLLILAAYAPFWEGTETVATALDEGGYYTVSAPAAVRGALAQAMDLDRAEAITSLLCRGLFAVAFVIILLRLRGDSLERLVAACFFAYFAYLALAATYFSPWHVVWPLTFAVLLPYRRDVFWPALTLSLTAMSVLVAAIWFRERFAPDPRADWYGMHLAAALSVFPLPVLVLLWTVRYPGEVSGVRLQLSGGRSGLTPDT